MAFDRTRLSHFRLLRLAGTVSALALASVSQTVWAQDTVEPEAQTSTVGDEQTEDDILVTGIRASLSAAQDIKRDSDTVVDAITAEDIGALPDRSVNEALQRIPGVAITRYASAEDSQHFSVEGSGVVIRGLQYVKGEFNGRDTFSTSGGREISFNDVAPELVGSVEVFKNLTPDMIEGGISGIVNINTRKPFDSNDQLIYLAGEINYGDLAGKGAPTVTGLYSNQWELSGGSRIGLLVSATYSKLYSKVDSAFVASPFERFNGTRTFNEGSPYESTVTDTFDCGGGLTSCYAPTGGGVRTQDFDRERIGISAAAQFATADDSFVATAQFLRSNGRNSWSEHTIEPNVWYPDVNATFPAPGTSYQFDDDGVFVSGAVRRPGGPHEGWMDGAYGPYPNFQNGGMFTTFSNRGFITDYTTDDYSLNLKFAPSERLRLSFDGQYVKARAEEVDVIVDTATFSNIDVDVSGKIPEIGFSIGPLPNGTTPNTRDYFANPGNIYFRDAFTDIDDNDGEEWAFRADAEYDLSDTGFLRRARVGGRYADRDQVVRNNNYNNWGAPSETWTGPNGAQFFSSIDSSNYELFQFDDFFRGAVAQPPGAVYLAGNIAENYDNTQDLLRLITSRAVGTYAPLEDRACATVNTYFCPNEVFTNSERTWAGYVRLDFGSDFDNGMSLDGNVGVRYVNTRDDAVGFLTVPQTTDIYDNTDPAGNPQTAAQYCALPRDPGDPVPGICRLDAGGQADVLAFANGAAYDFTAVNQYDHWLPSLNVRLKATDQLQFRFAASRALSRPNFGNLRAYLGVSAGSSQAGDLIFQSNSQNPYLRPIEATQFDLTAEWYFSRVGSLTAAAFYKRLTNYIDLNGQTVIDVTNNGQTFPVVLNGPVNREGTANIKGFEIAYQQTFDFLPGLLSGLGAQATYTYIEPGEIPNNTAGNGPGDGARPPGEVNDLYNNLPLTQLSKHNVNVAAFYDKEGFYARLAYSWRSRYLLSVRDCCFPFLPVYSEATGQLDGSIFFNVDEHFKLGFQGSNLLNEVTRTSFALYHNGNGEIVRSKRAAFINDRRLSVTARISF